MRFGKTSYVNELQQSMEGFLKQASVTEEVKEDSALVSAMEELSAAAEAYEKAGLVDKASQITEVMIALAGGKKKTDKKSKKPEKKDAKKPEKKGPKKDDKKKPVAKKKKSKEESEGFGMFGFNEKDLNDAAPLPPTPGSGPKPAQPPPAPAPSGARPGGSNPLKPPMPGGKPSGAPPAAPVGVKKAALIAAKKAAIETYRTIMKLASK